jgi:hypothetical protein
MSLNDIVPDLKLADECDINTCTNRYMSSVRKNKTATSNVAVDSLRVHPRPMDVMLGRGKSYRKNPGNMAFQGN